MNQGINIRGKLLGIRHIDRGQFKSYECGIQIEKDDGFDGITYDTFIIRVHENAADACRAVVNQYRGKIVDFPIWVGHYNGRNGTILQYNWDENRNVVPVVDSVKPGEKAA